MYSSSSLRNISSEILEFVPKSGGISDFCGCSDHDKRKSENAFPKNKAVWKRSQAALCGDSRIINVKRQLLWGGVGKEHEVNPKTVFLRSFNPVPVRSSPHSKATKFEWYFWSILRKIPVVFGQLIPRVVSTWGEKYEVVRKLLKSSGKSCLRCLCVK